MSRKQLLARSGALHAADAPSSRELWLTLLVRRQRNLECSHPCCLQVWTPLQFARALVQSFPWTPDPLSIANCCAEAAREPSAESYLAAPRQTPPSLFSGLTLSQVLDHW